MYHDTYICSLYNLENLKKMSYYELSFHLKKLGRRGGESKSNPNKQKKGNNKGKNRSQKTETLKGKLMKPKAGSFRRSTKLINL